MCVELLQQLIERSTTRRGVTDVGEMAMCSALLINLFVPLVNLVEVGAVQQSLLLQDAGVPVQAELLQVSTQEQKVENWSITGVIAVL